jgi:hypothetical protein
MAARTLVHMMYSALSDSEAFHIECTWVMLTES